jgi:adenylylsulfate kinase
MSSPAAEEVDAYKVGDSTNIKWHEGSVDAATREKALNQKGCVLWFTGLSGSGKRTVAYTLEHALFQRGKIAQVLDGDNIRHGLNSNLGFSTADREENIRRIGEVGKLFADSGMITLISFISPYRADRQKVRERVGDDKFVEVYMKIPLAVCEERDPKGLYKAARAGKIKGFTGIDDPYEEPLNAEIVMEVAKEGGDGTLAPPEKMAAAIIDVLEKKGFLTA